MEIEMCTCDHVPNLPEHTHVWKIVDMKYVLDPYDVRIWVDWKAVARPEKD